jgi:inner membrane protein
MTFRGHPSNTQALAEAADLPAVRRLTWFNHGFMQARVVGDELVLSDLRMGAEPDYFFRFAVARHGSDWQPISPRQLPASRDAGALWRATWERIWNEPQAPHDARR